MRGNLYRQCAFLAVCFCTGCAVVMDPCPDRRPTDDTVLSEIEAVSELTFENAKREGFQNIASRRCLPPDAQVHLVEKAMQELMFENSKLEVLLTLIKNPHFVSEGKKAVLEHLNGFMFDNSKKKILDALNRRGSVPSGSDHNGC